MAETIGSIQVIASINTKDYDAGKKHIEKGNNELEKSADKTSKGFSSAWAGAIGGLVATVAQKGFDLITRSVDNAIKRVDTLNNFPRVLELMGATTDDARKSTARLAKGLEGLPTPLQDGASGVQSLVTAGLGVGRATDAFLALNNALLVSGGGTQQAEAAMLQLQQAISRGKIEGQEWNTITASMPSVMQALQNETGKTKGELQKLYRTDPQKLIDDIIRLNKDGGGGLGSLEKQARTATAGIGTGIENMNTAITKGIASIIDSIGSENISNGISIIGKGFQYVLGFIAKGITVAIDAFKSLNTSLQPVYKFFNDNILPALRMIGAFIGGVFRQAWERVTVAFNKLMVLLEPFMPQIKILGAVILAALVAPLVIVIATLIAIIAAITAVVTAIAWFIGKIAELTSFIIDFSKKIGESFVSAYKVIYNTFSNIGSFFRGVWNTVVSIFTNIGTAIGNAVGGAFKSVVNSILRWAINTINGFIDGINTAIKLINKIPGVNIGKLGRLPMAQFANGGFTGRGGKYEPAGIVHKGEYVVPKQYVDQSTGLPKQAPQAPQPTQNATIVIPNQSSGEYRQGAINTIKAYNEYLRSMGLPQIGVA